MDRRDFLKKSAVVAGAIGFPYIVSSSALGKAGTVAPSNRIIMGCIGMGWQGPGNMNNFMSQDDCKVVAICDIDKKHLKHGVNMVNKKYGNNDCASYHDYREMMARDDIDAVMLAVPDHWHSLLATEAARNGKDIYGEKPLGHTVQEGRAICNAVKKYGVVWQTGSWQRSQSNFRHGAEIARNGWLGKVHTVEVGLPSGTYDRKDETFKDPPPELDYDRWLGPAPYAPYAPARCHVNWRWNLDYGGGQLTDWIGHHGDIAHWGMGTEYTAPVEIEGNGDYLIKGLWNTATKFRINTRYANGMKMIISGGHDDISSGTKWIGADGWVRVDRGGVLEASNPDLLKQKTGPNDIRLFKSPGHWRNFLDCVKSRSKTIAPVEVAHHSVIPGQLGQIAMLTGRKIKFDPKTEKIINDPGASHMLGKTMRAPWYL